MQETQTNNLKLMLKVLMVLAGVLSIVGGIILLAMVGKLTSISSLMYGSSSDLTSMMSSFTGIYSGQDLARFGAFALFIVSVIYAVVEVFSGSAKKNMALAAAGSSVLGFVGCFLTSITTLYNSVISVSSNMSSGNMYGGNRDQLMLQLIKRTFAPWVVGGIFTLVSAAVVITLVIATFIKPRPFYGYAAGNPYMQQPYPQYPNQPYPNQQYPGQQYPNQGYTGQTPVNYQPQDTNSNTPNNYQ